MQVRLALLIDAASIAEIYNQGVEDRVATFETRLRTMEDITSWFDGAHPIMLAEEKDQAVAFAATSYPGHRVLFSTSRQNANSPQSTGVPVL